MANTSFKFYTTKFTGAQGDMLMSPTEFKAKWLYGIPLCNMVTGQELSDDTIRQKLVSAQAILETEFSIKLFKQYITETKDFIREEFFSWGFLKTSWQILRPCRLLGRLNERQVIEYPYQWLSIKRGNENDNSQWKELYIMPNGEATVTFTYLLTQYPHYFMFYGARLLPNYWQIEYVTGFEKVPQEFMELIGLQAALDILPLIELTVGNTANTFGAANNSLSFDGLSQSSGKVNGGNLFQQRIKLYQDQLKDLKSSVKGAYTGIKFDVC